MENDERFMQRCLELAEKGLGFVAPNPLVGSVITNDNGLIIGEGYHHEYGGPHAEVNAINAVKNPGELKSSTIYVNLEPCSHYGKTPPCSDLIIEKGIPRVVIGCKDPFAEVSGSGIKKLVDAGCDVKSGVLEKESKKLNKRFFTFHQKKRPYVILKWAQTIDGFIDIARGHGHKARPTWITHENTRSLVHKWRSEEAAIMVGTQTAVKDNPTLNVRDWSGKNPTRVVIDENLALAQNLNIFNNEAKTIVYTAKEVNLKQNNIIYLHLDFTQNIIPLILNDLYKKQEQSVIIEGGRELLTSFIRSDLWDEARFFVGNQTFGKGVKAPEITGEIYSQQLIGDDRLVVLTNKNSK